MFSRNQHKYKQKEHKHREQSEPIIVELSDKKIQQLECLNFFMEHYYFPGWNVDRICTNKLLGMFSEYSEEELQSLVEDYSILSSCLYDATDLLLADSTYPNRRLHFDCRRLKGLLVSNESLAFYPKHYLGEKMYETYKSSYSNKLVLKMIGMFIDAYSVDECFQLVNSEERWKESVEEAIRILNQQFSTTNSEQLEEHL